MSATEVMSYYGIRQDYMQEFMESMTILDAAQSEVLSQAREQSARKPAKAAAK